LKTKRTPMRRCVGCMVSFPKETLVRLVAYDEKPEIDLTGKKNGRGAYLCRSIECFDMAMKKKRLNRALGISATDDAVQILRGEYEDVISGGR